MKKINYIALIIFVFLNSSIALAQSDMIGYGLNKTLPQANNLNPAMLPDYKFSFGLPGISGVHSSTGQNFTNLDLLTSVDENGNINTSDIFNKMRRNNRVTSDNTVSILHLGIRGLTSYTAFSINTKAFARVSLPKELFAFALYGNASDKLDDGLLDFSRGSIKTMAYTEIGISHGREILAGKMTVGARVKYLIGHAYADVKSLDANLRTYGNDEFRGDSIKMNVNQFDVRTAGVAGDLINGNEDVRGSALSNGGFGLDLGATYEYSKKIKFFASLNDLGFIKWNEQYTNKQTVPSFQYKFSGADVVELINGEDLSVVNDFDSVISDLEIKETKNESFSTSLTGKLYAGASYQLTRRQTASAILYSEFYRGALIPAFTAMYNFQGGTFFNFAFSATMMNGRVNNLGTGFTLNLIPFQLVLATNDLLSIVNPMKGRAVDIRFGINHTFGNLNKGKSRAKKNSNNTIDTIDLGID
ncbi:DUF5723 family protein [Marivirga salinae]|uniref:DUF5723 family protein n=1 Tax=Marivirga salinarum TaxID=3059078 RepID=A0AA49GB52_9BACT|nr:DUF5723 family protein [Marivirga sp. BDSF4-3]WKK76361.2 DUF5723 family protein [Marivirga sp. BDSF4-3]